MEFSYSAYVSKAGRQLPGQKKTQPPFLPSVHLLNDMKYNALISVSLAMRWIPHKHLGYFSLELASSQTPFVCTVEALPLCR